MLALPDAAVIQPVWDTGLLLSPPSAASPWEVAVTLLQVSQGPALLHRGMLAQEVLCSKKHYGHGLSS